MAPESGNTGGAVFFEILMKTGKVSVKAFPYRLFDCVPAAGGAHDAVGNIENDVEMDFGGISGFDLDWVQGGCGEKDGGEKG